MDLDHFLTIIICIIVVGGPLGYLWHYSTKGKRLIEEKQVEWKEMRAKINTRIQQLANQCELTIVPASSNSLEQIKTAVLNRCKEAEREFLEKNAIKKTDDSHSTLGLCGVSETKFFYNIRSAAASYITKVLNTGNVHHMYISMLEGMSEEASLLGRPTTDIVYSVNSYYKRINDVLSIYEEALNNNLAIGLDDIYSSAIDLDDIQYYKIEGAVHYVSEVSGGDVNLSGAIAGAIIAGGAGAVIGSRIGTGINTQTVEKDQREIVFVYKKDTHLNYLKIYSFNVSETIDALHALIPQKDAAVIALTK